MRYAADRWIVEWTVGGSLHEVVQLETRLRGRWVDLADEYLDRNEPQHMTIGLTVDTETTIAHLEEFQTLAPAGSTPDDVRRMVRAAKALTDAAYRYAWDMLRDVGGDHGE